MGARKVGRSLGSVCPGAAEGRRDGLRVGVVSGSCLVGAGWGLDGPGPGLCLVGAG